MTKDENSLSFQSPISLEDLQKIDQSKLSSLDRHHVRLLAHCLYIFKFIKKGVNSKTLPDQDECVKWCFSKSELADDSQFRNLVLDQFIGATKQLKELSESINVKPLDLTVEDLLNAHKK